MQLTQEQEKKLKRIAKLVDFETKGAVVLIEDIFALEDEFGAKIPELRELVEELKKERPDRDEIKEIVSELINGIEKVEPEKGDKGDDYILTEDDKKEIASKIKVPVVEKIIEKTEVIKEQPIEIIKEVAVITDEAITSRGEAIRDGLELLQDDDRLDKKAIKGFEDYEEVAKLAKASQFLNRGGNGKGLLSQMNDTNIQSPTDGQGLVYNATTGLWENETIITPETQNLQQVTDIGATTTNVITVKAQPTFTYTAGLLTGITYTNGTTKALTYNGDSTLNTLTITYPTLTPIVKTFHWTAGVLTSVTVA